MAEALYWCGDCYTKEENLDLKEAYKRFKRLDWDYPASKWAKFARGRLLGEDNADVGYWAATLLGRLGAEATGTVPALVKALTDRFIDAMHEDFGALGIGHADHEPRATEYIPGILAMIARLIERGHAYVGANGDVYYNVASFPTYGRLSGKRISELRAGARVEVNESKADPLDFVLGLT